MITGSFFSQGSFALPSNGDPKFRSRSLSISVLDSQVDAKYLKVLLVDDNVDLLDIAETLFRRNGFEVFTAASGPEAVEILRRTPDIGVLFTDVVMPGMSGIQLGHEARKILPDIKVILVSGYANAAANAGHGGLRDFDFLNKPYRFDEIARLLHKPN